MDFTEFTTRYSNLSDDELLVFLADRDTLVPEAAIALDTEVQKRGLKKQDAVRFKHRLDALAARERKGSLANQVATAKYERNMRHFEGWKEPEFLDPYRGSRDIRTTFAYFRHKYRVWKAFREHTGHWPVFSIWFHFLSWTAAIVLCTEAVIRVADSNLGSGWRYVIGAGCFVAILGVRDLGARFMRKLDWKKFGRSNR